MSRNLFSQKQKKVQRSLREGTAGGNWWEFGQIQEVNEEDSGVKVLMFSGSKSGVSIGWHPLRKGEGTLRDLQARFGKLRRGMCCIVHYRGKLGRPMKGSTFIEIIGEGPNCGEQSVIKQDPEPNEKETAAFLMMSGGLLA